MLAYTIENRSEERRLIFMSLCIAVAIHVAFAFVRLPEIRRDAWLDEPHTILVVRKYIPPPPQIERPARAPVARKRVRIMPVPDPTPDEIEPLREPEPEFYPDVLPPDAEFLIGDPEPPPPQGPLLAGVGGVTNPTRIAESYIPPDYPELARKAKIEGKVFLQAIVQRNGDIGEVSLLRCNRPGLGFEESAIGAVEQWKYEPATQNGKPIDVFITVIVNYTLQ